MKISKLLSSFIVLAVLAGACKKEVTPDDKMNLFADNLVQKISMQQIDSIKQYYPAIEKADSLVAINPNDSVVILENKSFSGEYIINLNNNVTLVATLDKHGDIRIKSSKGLFAYSPDKMEFAKKTGMFNDSLYDAELADRMNDKDFISYLDKKAMKLSKNILKIGEPGYDLDIEIINLTDQPIKGSDYDIKKSEWERYERGWSEEKGYDWDYGSRTYIVKGKPIPPHGKIYEEHWGGSGGGVTVEDLIIKISPEDLRTRFMKYSGNEYTEYQKDKESKK